MKELITFLFAVVALSPVLAMIALAVYMLLNRDMCPKCQSLDIVQGQDYKHDRCENCGYEWRHN